MTQSGNTGTILTRNDIIEASFKRVGLLAEGDSLTAQQIDDGKKTLNSLIFHYINKNLKIWKRKFATLFLQQGVSKYSIGNTARCAEEVVETTLSADATTATAGIIVASATGMTIGDQLGILTSTILYWYTIVNIAGTTITLERNLDVDVTANQQVFTYTDTISKPLNIDQAMIQYLIDNTETELTPYSREEYFALNNKAAQGRPYNFYQDRQLDFINVYLYLTPQNSENAVRLSYTSPLFINDSAADQMDFPKEYTELLIYALGSELCSEYGVEAMTTQRIDNRKMMIEDEVSAFDSEPASILLSPNMRD